MINIFNHQIILEGCCQNCNFKIIANWNYLFNDYILNIKYYTKNQRKKLFTFFEIHNSNFLPPEKKDIFIKMYVKLCKREES